MVELEDELLVHIELHVDILIERFLIYESVVGKSVIKREVRLFGKKSWLFRMSTDCELAEVGQASQDLLPGASWS